MFTRSQFEIACKAFIQSHNEWSFSDCFLSRTAIYLQSLDVVDDTDDTIAPTHSIYTSSHYIVYSPTFRVPTFYFTIHDSNGSPLHLDQIVKSPLFRPHALPEPQITSFALTLPTSDFPLLSQGEHPNLGTPCWYLHPCQTAPAVNELIQEIQHQEWSNEHYLLKWMEMWFMLVGSIVDFGA